MRLIDLEIRADFSPWLREVLFAASALLTAVEDSDPALVTDAAQEAARDLRRVLDDKSAH